MNKRLLLALAALILPLLGTSNSYSADTNAAGPTGRPAQVQAPPGSVIADLNDLITKINEKLKQDKKSEADLGDNLKEFDTLIAKHKDGNQEDLARVLAMKAQLYMEVLDEPEKALEVFKRIRTDYPTAQINGNTDQVLVMLQGMIDRKKVRDALAPGAAFPDFSESDVEGNPLSISKYKGKVVLVDFWATWCMPCIEKLPEIQKAYDKFHEKGFEVVGISLDEDKGRLQQFVRQKKMPWPEFFDGKRWENKLAVKYGVDATPTGYLLDRDGKIIVKITGQEDLDSVVGQALKK